MSTGGIVSTVNCPSVKRGQKGRKCSVGEMSRVGNVLQSGDERGNKTE